MTTMLDADTTISVRHLQRGQPRPYADHTYESIIQVEATHKWNRLLDNQVKAVAHAVVHPFTEDKSNGTMGDHYLPRLTHFALESTEALDPDNTLGAHRYTYRVRVQIPFTD